MARQSDPNPFYYSSCAHCGRPCENLPPQRKVVYCYACGLLMTRALEAENNAFALQQFIEEALERESEGDEKES